MLLVKRFIVLVSMSIVPGAMASGALQFRGIAEFGFLSVLSHQIQFGRSGTNFDYVENGGQDVLFPATRFSVEMDIGKRNTLILLYQPLRLETRNLLQKDVIVDNCTFPASTGIACLYSFPFYRASYLRELLSENSGTRLAVGLSMQIRNATISFESTDGSAYRTNRDVGPVPALKVRGSVRLTDCCFIGLEADGIYAPVSY